MRILKLTLKNINSLSGENKIDFTLPAFINDGLFAITGKTGAGKSSILDAISLALYGKTPRVNISASENPVMTKGEKDCFAEIEFEAGGNVWKASWKQELTKTGNLKPVSRLIAADDGKILADQIRSCDAEIIKIIGLTFEQFTKVIMLAQGSFAAFLQADKNEKGELLEQITGTEIYAQISRLVYENSAEEKKKLDRLSFELEHISILSEEEISFLKQEIEITAQEKATRDLEFTKLEKAKNWLEEVKQLAVAIENGKVEIPTLQEAQKALLTAVENQRQLVASAKETLRQQQPILKKVNILDAKIADKTNSLAPVNLRIAQLEREQKEANQKITSQKEALILATKKLTTKVSWAKENQKYEVLVSKFSALEHENIIVTQAKEEVQKLKTALDALEKDHSAKKETFEKSSEQLSKKSLAHAAKEKELTDKKAELSNSLGGKKPDELQAEKERKTQLNNYIAKFIELENSILSTEKEINNYQEIIETTKNQSDALSFLIEKEKKDIEVLQTKIDLLTENIQLIRKVENLEEHRQLLTDGEPCPLCGAEEHPYAKGNNPKLGDKEVELNHEKEKYKILTNSIQANDKKLSELNANQKHASENISKSQLKLNDTTAEKETITKNIKSLDIHFVLPKDENVLTSITSRFEQNNNEINQINEWIQKAQTHTKDIEILRDTLIPNLLKEKDDAQSAKNKAENAFQLAAQQLIDKSDSYHQKRKSYENDQSKLLAELKVYGVTQIEDLEKCLNDWNVNQTNIKTLNEEIDRCKNQLQILEKELENIRKSLFEKENEKAVYTNELDQLNKDRKDLFGEKLVEETEKQLESAIKAEEKAFEAIKKEGDDLTVKLKETSAVLKEKEQTLHQKKAEQLTDKTSEEIHEIQQKLRAEADAFGEKIGENRQKLSTNEQNINANDQKLKEKEKQQAIYNKWKNLDNLIGSSDGKKYRNFAQTLTFEHLIGLANKQLQKMSDRYLLKRVGDNNNPFDLAVIDKFQNNDERTAQNLSGGEKFIVSLSLALGLASMASKNMRIDTMFIDEGFGTLDADYLDVALNALSNLQSEGKTIGVISHLSELKERIATHIEIISSSTGHSKIQITA